MARLTARRCAYSSKGGMVDTPRLCTDEDTKELPLIIEEVLDRGASMRLAGRLAIDGKQVDGVL